MNLILRPESALARRVALGLSAIGVAGAIAVARMLPAASVRVEVGVGQLAPQGETRWDAARWGP